MTNAEASVLLPFRTLSPTGLYLLLYLYLPLRL
jgi:hypothetical protein